MDDLRPRLEKALAGTYVFERELGGGGMSRTYLVREKALDRRVVVKVLAPELLAGMSVERFRREILLAAQLQHPHVVPVLTAGDTDGLPWFTMPYVDGDSLRHRLAHGDLGISETVGILRDVARALAYAHAHGVVHRDIKPDNVLLSAGSATVTDFGIAKAISAARGAESGPYRTELTVAGTSIGTPTYMSPEQAAGDPSTDHRADLYAFGVMAYEMLAGHPPFHGLTPSKLLAAHMGVQPRDVRELRPECPEQLAVLVMQCLEKEPSARPAAASDIARVLETITSSGATAAAPAILAGGRIRFARALAMWAGATALVGVTAWAATDVIGLPDWVFPGAVGVMMAGLPVIIATWYAQRAVHRAYTATPTRTPGGGVRSSTQPAGTMATIAIKASPHLSWRRAWLGGGVAVGSFAALVIVFMVMRAMGIGPFGSLRGTGAFRASETIVVADFQSPAGDSTLGGTAAEALRTDLAQSRALRVLTRANMRDVLRLMQRPAESAMPFELSREIATREGAKAVLDGGITKLGQSYVISARLVNALDGSELAAFRETARGEDELLEALGRVTRAVRDRAGESLKFIRQSNELERVTTPSLAALRKYVEGSQAADELGDSDRGLALLQEAVEIDTSFSMAWRKISVLLGNEGRERERAIRAIENAYRHRDRLSEVERLLTTGYYYNRGPRPDAAKALDAYQQVVALDSLSTSGLNNAAVILTDQREFAKAADLYQRVMDLPRTFGGAFTNLSRVASFLGDTARVRHARDAYAKRFPESGDRWESDAYLFWSQRDLVSLDTLTRRVAASARTRRQATANSAVAALAMLRGRPAESMVFTTRASQNEYRADPTPYNAFFFLNDTAIDLANARGRTAEARAVLARGLQRIQMSSIPAAERPWREVARIAADVGDAAIAKQALDGFVRDQAASAPDPEGRTAFFRALHAFAAGRYEESIREIRIADDRRMTSVRFPMVLQARAFDNLNQPDSAITYFERFLRTPEPDLEFSALYEAGSLRRLGELYEAKGDKAKAIAYYERFIDLWKDAEPEMQPKVRDVKARLDRLRPAR